MDLIATLGMVGALGLLLGPRWTTLGVVAWAAWSYAPRHFTAFAVWFAGYACAIALMAPGLKFRGGEYQFIRGRIDEPLVATLLVVVLLVSTELIPRLKVDASWLMLVLVVELVLLGSMPVYYF